MLAQIMFVKKRLLHRRNLGINQPGFPCHLCQFFQNHCVMNSVAWIFSPGKRAMALNKNARHLCSVKLQRFKSFHNHFSSIQLIIRTDFRVAHQAGAWNRPIEIITMRCPQRGDCFPRLTPRRRILRMSMHNAADRCEVPIQFKMRHQIAARFVSAFDHLTLPIADDHTPRLHRLIVDAARVDHNQPAFSVNAADVSPGKR